MNAVYCPQCGHANPPEARFCMSCGQALAAVNGQRQAPARAGGTDWAAIVAAVLAFLSLRHASRKARQATIVITFLVLFFGCPMVCGFMAFAMEWIARLFQQ